MNYRQKETYQATAAAATGQVEFSKLDDYAMLVKFKLTMLVVVTSVLGYAIVAGSQFSLFDMSLLFTGGFLVTSAANALNQVLEKEFDKWMQRTKTRPVTAGRMKTSEAVVFAGLSCLIGISILAWFNPLTSLLGMLSLIAYAFIYTPLKRYGTISVAIGAIPGALPVLIGCTAFDGYISSLALGLFLIQFLWQFPHFWAIGFLSFDDYHGAGFKVVPEVEGKIDEKLGLSTLIYSMLLIPTACFLLTFANTSIVASILASVFSIGYIYYSYIFYKQFDRKAARNLMFYSFFYLPMVLLAYLIF